MCVCVSVLSVKGGGEGVCQRLLFAVFKLLLMAVDSSVQSKSDLAAVSPGFTFLCFVCVCVCVCVCVFSIDDRCGIFAGISRRRSCCEHITQTDTHARARREKLGQRNTASPLPYFHTFQRLKAQCAGIQPASA